MGLGWKVKVAITRNMKALRGTQKLRLTVDAVCNFLSVERDKLNKLSKSDSNFPIPIKEGTSRQEPVYFDHAELVEWWEVKKQARYS